MKTKPKTLTCDSCKSQISEGEGFGYYMPDGSTNFDSEKALKACYACCAKRDLANMLELGRYTLYLSMDCKMFPEGESPSVPEVKLGEKLYRSFVKMDKFRRFRYLFIRNEKVINWPGSLEFKIESMRVGNHNMSKVRFDVRFLVPNAANQTIEVWHGTRYGTDTEVLHCRRTKIVYPLSEVVDGHKVTRVVSPRGYVSVYRRWLGA